MSIQYSIRNFPYSIYDVKQFFVYIVSEWGNL
jgi:hypothetical protein